MTKVRYTVRFGRERPVLPEHKDGAGHGDGADDRRSDPPVSRDKRASARTLLAVAYFVERSIADGSIANFDEAAAVVGVSRARLSQIMRLMDLPSEVQAKVLLGAEEIAERRLRGLR